MSPLANTPYSTQKVVMKRHLISLALAAVLALSCQSSEQAHASPDTNGLSALYGDYLAGTYAQEILDRDAQQKHFTNAFLNRPDDVRIGRRAIVSAIETGDMAAAVKLADKIRKNNEFEPLGRAVCARRSPVDAGENFGCRRQGR